MPHPIIIIDLILLITSTVVFEACAVVFMLNSRKTETESQKNFFLGLFGLHNRAHIHDSGWFALYVNIL